VAGTNGFDLIFVAVKAVIQAGNEHLEIDLSEPIDITIPIGRSKSPNAFYLHEAEFTTVEAGSFLGNVARGGSCNCEDVTFNPHGNGTHTECAGHISREPISIYKVLHRSLYTAMLITLAPEEKQITMRQMESALKGNPNLSEALIVRTIPNDAGKKHRNYSGSNPPWFEPEALKWVQEKGVKHLITDLPSLDREDDDELKAHRAFFEEDGKWATDRTVTEMVYVSDEVGDGNYIAEIQIAAFESDASPSRVRLFKIL
jgi:kynurenine formamidase